MTVILFYDDADRVIRRVLPGGRVVQFGYDSSGNLTSLTPALRSRQATIRRPCRRRTGLESRAP